MRKFAYDVGVNVLANLVAAAIIDLLGVLVGVLPSDPRLIGIAFTVAFGGLVSSLMIASQFLKGGRGMQAHWLAVTGIGCFTFTGAITSHVEFDPLPRPIVLVAGAVLAYIGASSLFAERRKAHRDRAGSSGRQDSPPDTPDAPTA